MVTWADVDSAIESERQRRAKRVDTVTMAAALLILLCAIWLAWPTLSSLFSDKGVALAGFGAPMLLLFWGLYCRTWHWMTLLHEAGSVRQQPLLGQSSW